MTENTTAVETKRNEASLVTLVQKDKAVFNRFAQFMNPTEVKAFLGTVLSLAQSNTSFKDVAPLSILSAAQLAAQNKLSVIPTMGEAAIIPYYDSKKGIKLAQFQIMTNGLVQLAMRSGDVATLNATEIYEDEFNGFDKVKSELKPLKEHDPKCKVIVGYAAYVRLTNGGEHTEYWTKAKVEEHRAKFSKAKNSPWDTNFDAMAKKTVLKYTINHYCPKSVQMKSILEADQAIVTPGLDGAINLDYTDNPNGMEFQYSEEEKAERSALLERLRGNSITEERIIKSTKDARTIDDVSTQRLRDLADNN